MYDTIAAISTAQGVGAISIVRVSGEESLEIVNKIFDRDIYSFKSNTINYGHIFDGDKIVDEVLVSIFLAPKTYTKEDIVEINTHGGISVTNKILELLLDNGARLAEPGEFTKRAFLNGRIDRLEAEGIMDLINSKTEQSRKVAINTLNGEVTNNIKELREKLVSIISNIEVNIDYPEYEDIEVLTNEKVLPDLNNLKESIEKVIKESYNGKIINEGINVAIIGKPNVGKSSILNLLLGEEKAIVTDIEGTTRDIVEGSVVLNGVILNILDTAGIRETDNLVEKIGVEKSKELIEKADLLLFVLNSNEEINEYEKELINIIKEKNYIVVLNKTDLKQNIDISNYNFNNVVKISAKNNDIEELKNKIIEIYNLDKIETMDVTYLSNSKDISLLKESKKYIESAIKSIKNNVPIDMVEIDIKESCQKLNEILGENYNDNLLNELFSNFCLGK